MNLSIQQKLLAGFGIVLVLLVGALALSLSTMSAINDRTHTLGARDLVAIDALGQVRSGIMTMRAAGGDNLQVTTAAMKNVTAEAVTSARATVLAGLQVYGQHLGGAADRRAFATVKRDTLAVVAGSDHTMALSAQGRVKQAVANFAATQPLMPTFNNDSVALAAARLKASSADTASAASAYDSARLTILLVGLACVAVGIAVALVLSRRISGGVRELRRVAEAIADGDVEQRVALSSGDELGATANAFRTMISYLHEMASTADRVADGDLSVDVQPRSERDLLGNSFRRLVSTLGDAIGRVVAQAASVNSASKQMEATSEETGRASNEIAHAVGDVAAGTERQVQMIDEARRSAEEVVRAVGEAAQSAQHTAEVAHEAREVAQRGVGAAEQANQAMRSVRESSTAVSDAIRELAAKSEQIGAIVQTITGIAEQTNLLALNAAIEAARAGEQGRGFAVVAEEVRKLAEGSQAAAHEISQLIGAIQQETGNAVRVVEDGAQRTQDGATVVEQTREAFLQIGTAVEDMTARIEQIAAASQQITASAHSMQDNIGEVAAVAEQSSASTEQVSASTEQTSATAHQIAASAHELSGSADELNRLIARFKLAA
ncbi:MAG: HAMP domain-containing methyl-accepting chemotaxis protein [Solirubrobacteraceae bacterium]